MAETIGFGVRFAQLLSRGRGRRAPKSAALYRTALAAALVGPFVHRPRKQLFRFGPPKQRLGPEADCRWPHGILARWVTGLQRLHKTIQRAVHGQKRQAFGRSAQGSCRRSCFGDLTQCCSVQLHLVWRSEVTT